MKRIRNGLSLLLIGTLLLCVMPAIAIGVSAEVGTAQFPAEVDSFVASRGEDETLVLPFLTLMGDSSMLYGWTASDIDVDCEEFTSNLISNGEADVRWNETAIMYTGQGTREVVLHTFLNETRGSGSENYGLPQTENLVIEDTSFTGSTQDMESVDLAFLYAYKPDGKSLNAATSGLLRVYVSEDGTNWSEDYVGVRFAQILGCGTSQTGETVIYYEIHCEDLMEIDSLTTGDNICGVRIMPDGETGAVGGTFALCELAVTGYERKAAFEAAIPVRVGSQSAVVMDEDAVRKGLVDAAAGSDEDSSLGKITDALALVSDTVPVSAQGFLTAAGIALADGIDVKAKDTIYELLTWMQEWDIQWTPEMVERLLVEYETLETTGHIVKDLNTPQQIFRAYANAEPGDLLLRIAQDEADVYMITDVDAVFYPDRVNVDFPNSEMTYLTADGERTQSFFELFGEQEFVPLTVSELMNISWLLDAHVSIADGVRVAVVSDLPMEACEITVGDTTVILDDLDATTLICSDHKELDAAVEALAPGKYEMTVDVTNALGATETIDFAFEVKEEESTPEVAFTLNGLNLRLQDLIRLGFYFNVETEAELSHVGALLWTAEEYDAETDFTVSSTKAYKATAAASGDRYVVETEGIYVQHLDTVYYIIPYAVTAAGDYVYGQAGSSSALVYARIAYTGGTVTEDTKSIVIDLLNYATRARTYFGYAEGLAEPETPFNAILSEEDRTLDWDDSLKADYPTVQEMTGTYQPTINGLNANLNEAIRLNFIFDGTIHGEIGYWTEEEYTAAAEHSYDTVAHWATISTSAAGNTVGSVTGIYSFDIYSNFYVVAFDADGNGSRAYGASVASYLTTIINKDTTSASEEDLAMVELAKAMLIYGDNAMQNPDVSKGSN